MKTIKWVKDVIKSSDYFSRNVQLIFNNRAKFPTYLGGILTLMILSLTVALIVNLGSELVYRKSPKTNIHNQYNAISPIIYFNNAIKIDPLYFHAYNNKGILLCELGKYQDAIINFEIVLIVKFVN
jgi:tetratricopeptide (TPR) repeat protein